MCLCVVAYLSCCFHVCFTCFPVVLSDDAGDKVCVCVCVFVCVCVSMTVCPDLKLLLWVSCSLEGI